MEYNNSGILFKNKFKKEEKQPDLVGNITIENKKYSLAAWLRSNQKGEFTTIKVSEFKEKEQRENKTDDLPF